MTRHHDRHELQTNELAVYLGKINRSIEPYSKPIAIVIGLLIVGGISWGLYNSKVSGDRSDATLQLIQAVGSSNAERLASVSENYPETTAASWSRLYEGNTHLAGGLRALYVDREDAKVQLDDARAAFNAALTGADDRLLRSRGYFGLARVAESLGEIDEAIEAYRKCIEVNESEAMVDQAQSRIDALSKPQTKEFLVWFSEQDFKPADPSLPPSLPAEKTLPDMPDLNLPMLEQLGGGDSDDGEDNMKLEDGEGLELPDDAEVKAEEKAEAGESTDPPAEKTEASDETTSEASSEAAEPTETTETTEPDKTESAESSDADKE